MGGHCRVYGIGGMTKPLDTFHSNQAPMTPIIRQATAEDAPAILALTRAAYAKWVPLIGREPRPMLADYDVAIRDHRIEILYLGSSLAGLIEMVPGLEHLLIENIAVAPEFQRRGLARQLMAHAETLAAAQGVSVLKLYTNKQFSENIRLYQSLGYTVDREEPYKNGLTVYMSKSTAR